MGFRSLQHTTGLRVHFPRALPARYVPPSGFGYPLDGLLPAIPCRFCFTPAALVGFTLRSFLLSKGIRAFPSGRTHLPFRPPVYPMRMHQAGSTGYGSWVLTLSEVPDDPHVFSTRPAGCSLGFGPSRVRQRKPWPGFRPASSHALLAFRPRRPGVSIGSRPGSAPGGKPPDSHDPTLLGFSHQHRPSHSGSSHPSYAFTSRSCAHFCA